MLDKEGDLNIFSKMSIEKAIQDDDYLSNSHYSIKVHTYHLLYFSLTLNNGNNHIIIEFENVELLTPIESLDKYILKKIQIIIKEQTEIISKKLFSVLYFNKKYLLKLNYCIDIKLALKLSIYDDEERNEIFYFIIHALKEKLNIYFNADDDEDMDDMNNLANMPFDFTYLDYCKWLYFFECSLNYKGFIPKSYKINFEKLYNN